MTASLVVYRVVAWGAVRFSISAFLAIVVFDRQGNYNGGLWIGAPFGEPGAGYPRLMTLLRHTVDIRH